MHTILEINNLTVTYPKTAHCALKAINLTIKQGQMIALVGPNGAGKSTLFKTILGLKKKSTGTISFYGSSCQSSKIIKEKVAYIPQLQQVNWQFPATVFDIVLMGRFAHNKNLLKRPSKRDKKIATDAIGHLKLESLKNHRINHLSGGQQQRVFIARALAQEAEIYLLDEPLTGVDNDSEQQIMSILKNLQKDGKTIIAIHHDLQSLNRYFTHVIWLNKTIIANGALPTYFNPDIYQKTYHGHC